MPNRDISKYGDDDWQRVGEAINERMLQLGLKQQAVADRSGLSLSTIRPIRSGKPLFTPSEVTLTDLAKALEWPYDALRRILAGENPAGIERVVDVVAAPEQSRRPPSYDERINALPPAARRLVEGMLESALELAEREAGNNGRGRSDGPMAAY